MLVQNQPYEEDIMLVSPCVSQGEFLALDSALSNWLTLLLLSAYEDDELTPSPVTPTQPPSQTAPITPPATPRRLNRPAPPALKPSTLKSTYSSDGSMSHSGSEDSSDTLASDDESATPRRSARRRQEVFTTPPQQTRGVFQSEDRLPGADGALPPSPVTPTSHRRPRAAATRSVSPRAAARTSAANRRRKASFDSSSSSSGNSSQPPTPTGPPPHYGHSSTSALDYGLTNHVRIVDSSSPRDHEMTFANSADGDEQSYLRAAKPIATEVQSQVHTAFYPVIAQDWAEGASSQAHYSVTLPPPVFLPHVADGEEAYYDFPLPPTGYYHSKPAHNGEPATVSVQEA